ncbi:MAG: glutamate-5-semialdehyde dehydrogenase [Brevefilum sp.]|nr:glutamate-5-semialdehyde dehydrogenase [Brevefilum sp.]
MVNLHEMGKLARQAARHLAVLDPDRKNQALIALADLLVDQSGAVLSANAIDIHLAEEAGLPPAMIDRLRLSAASLAELAGDVRKVAELPDPVGTVFDQKVLANGLRVHRQRVPIGVLAVIYESRPNVTVDVSSLALKSGNAVILRGGKETLNSNRALLKIIQETLTACAIPPGAVQFVDSSDRADVLALIQMADDVDMLIPRGGAGLHRFCREKSRIPVMTGGIGICHLFVDESANQEMAVKIIHNAKTQRPSVCNSLDTVLVHHAIAEGFIPAIIEHLQEAGVEFRLDPAAMECIQGVPYSPEMVSLAGPDDFDTEWLSLILGVRVVGGLDQAIEHIQFHSTGHSDGILTRDEGNANRFIQQVDSAAVYVNASTRFTDGGQLGLGAEVAVSTQRLHARGPMGLEELTTYKWVIRGDDHVRE